MDEQDVYSQLVSTLNQLQNLEQEILHQARGLGADGLGIDPYKMMNHDGSLAMTSVVVAKAQVLHALSPLVRAHRQKQEAEAMMSDVKAKWDELMGEIKKPQKE